MKKALVAVLAAVALGGCTSVEWTAVNRDDVTTNHGEPIAVVQANAVGLNILFHTWEVAPADLDVAVNKVLVSEAKAMGASKVELKGAASLPRHGLFRIITCPLVVLCPTFAGATGVAVK